MTYSIVISRFSAHSSFRHLNKYIKVTALRLQTFLIEIAGISMFILVSPISIKQSKPGAHIFHSPRYYKRCQRQAWNDNYFLFFKRLENYQKINIIFFCMKSAKNSIERKITVRTLGTSMKEEKVVWTISQTGLPILERWCLIHTPNICVFNSTHSLRSPLWSVMRKKNCSERWKNMLWSNYKLSDSLNNVNNVAIYKWCVCVCVSVNIIILYIFCLSVPHQSIQQLTKENTFRFQ